MIPNAAYYVYLRNLVTDLAIATEKIGSDPRWLMGGEPLLRQLLEQYLGSDEAEAKLAQANLLSISSRQVAIRQYVSDGIKNAFSPDKVDHRTRSTIRKRIQMLLAVSEGHANRIMNGLGVFAKDTLTGTRELADQYFSSQHFIKEIDIELLLLLAMGSSEHLEQYAMKPFQFAANAAAAALRLKITPNANEDSIDAKLRIKSEFPAFTQMAPQSDASAVDGPSPDAKMALYGLYVWQSGRLRFEDSQHEVNDEQLVSQIAANTIRWAASETPWVFPELAAESAKRIAAQQNPKYVQAVHAAVASVARHVGEALCGLPPFTLHLEMRKDDKS